MSRIAVIGTGYVGLTTAACFSHLGHVVVGADVDVTKIERLRRGELPITEPGLDDDVAFSADPYAACHGAAVLAVLSGAGRPA